MTPEKVVELARGVIPLCYPTEDADLLAFAQLVRNEVLEECALLCDARSERGSPAVAADESGLIAEQLRNMKS